jgi:hypothetical protein
MPRDIDNLNGDVEAVREKLRQDKHVAHLFLSPTGTGLKVLVAVNLTHLSILRGSRMPSSISSDAWHRSRPVGHQSIAALLCEL